MQKQSRYHIVLILCLFSLVQLFIPISTMAQDEQRFTSVGNIGLTLSNYGTLGDGFVNQRPVDFPSCEYPKGSGIEHMFDGGLWVGGITEDGRRHVTTGAVDVSSIGDKPNSGFEFTSITPIQERSSIALSNNYNGDAISHQDFVADFTDTNLVIPETQERIRDHSPLGLVVHMESYAWDYPFADAFVILNYSITNVSNQTISDVYVGLWADLVIRNTNITSPNTGAPFFQHVANGYVDSLNLAYAFDYDGDPGYTDSYVAFKLLGATPQNTDQTYRTVTHYDSWQFRNTSDPVFFSPQDDNQKYQRMKGTLTQAQIDSLNNGGNNRMTLLTTGPFAEIAPDSTINVVFAVVCADKYGNTPTKDDTREAKTNLFDNSHWAQVAYRGEDRNGNGQLDSLMIDGEMISEDINGDGVLNRYVLPTPPRAPHVKVIPGDRKVTLRWDAATAENSRDLISGKKDFEGYKIYRSKLGSDLREGDLFGSLSLIAEADSIDDIGYDTGFEPYRMETPVQEVIPSPKDPAKMDTVVYRYQYINSNVLNGWQYAYSVTAYDRGDPENGVEVLESSKLRTVQRVIPGTPAQKTAADQQQYKVGVYPNPYRVNAVWDGNLERERKLYFYNLPPKSEVRIYTLAGDLVDKFTHNADQPYTDENEIEWFKEYSGKEKVVAGGEHAWDIVTKFDQALATGLYIWVVRDLDSDRIQRGRFVIIK